MSASDRVRDRLEQGHWPRVHAALIVGMSSAVAFLVTFALTTAGVRSMPLRYGIAAVAGYVTFVALIGAWVRWKSSRLVRDPPDGLFDAVEGVINSADLSLARPPTSGGGSLFAGGRSAGGGAASSFISPSSRSGGAGGGGVSLDFDADDLVWVIVALAALFAGVAAVGYAVYVAPTLLAEAAVNAAIAGKVMQGMKRHDSSHWTTHVIRRTAVSALVVVLSAVAAGYALQRLAPEARSIGGVWQHMRNR